MFARLTIGLFALVLAVPCPAAPARPGRMPQAPERDSLEAYLERARRERAAVHARLSPAVEAALDRFRSPGADLAASRAAALESLVALGPEATPLLVQYLEPPLRTEPAATPAPPPSQDGEDAQAAADEPSPERAAEDEQAARLAEFVADALVRMGPAPIADPLLELLAEGRWPVRLRAARVLAAVPGNTAVRTALRSTYETCSGDLEAACFSALVELGGKDLDALLVSVLGGTDMDLARTALAALARTANAEAAPAVAAVLASPRRAARLAGDLVAYYRAVPDAADAEVTGALAELAVQASASDVKLLILEALPDLEPSLSSTRRRLEPLVESRDADLREAALKTLALLGDRGARRDLLTSYDETVERNKRWSQAYARRAELLLEIRDFDDAIRDFKRALELGKNDPNIDSDIYLNLARCYAHRERYRDASEWLRRAPISLAQLRALADEQAFAGLRASRWGAEAFALEEGQ